MTLGSLRVPRLHPVGGMGEGDPRMSPRPKKGAQTRQTKTDQDSPKEKRVCLARRHIPPRSGSKSTASAAPTMNSMGVVEGLSSHTDAPTGITRHQQLIHRFLRSTRINKTGQTANNRTQKSAKHRKKLITQISKLPKEYFSKIDSAIMKSNYSNQDF